MANEMAARGAPDLGKDVVATDLTFCFTHIHHAAKYIRARSWLCIAVLRATY